MFQKMFLILYCVPFFKILFHFNNIFVCVGVCVCMCVMYDNYYINLNDFYINTYLCIYFITD